MPEQAIANPGSDTEYSYDYYDEDGDEDEEEEVEEYSFDLDGRPDWDPFELHSALFKYLQVVRTEQERREESRARLSTVFGTVCALVDPYTKPSDLEDEVLSLDTVSSLVIGLCSSLYTKTELPKFAFAYDLGHIVERCLHVTHGDNESVLWKVQPNKDWAQNVQKWTPGETLGSGICNIADDYHRLKIVYAVSTVAVMSMAKLYAVGTVSVCMCPFLGFFFQVWKNQTRVMYLGIELDRLDEQQGFPGYPDVVREVVRGSSALRSALALILNNEFEKRMHDLKHEPLSNFMNPWGRQVGSGALSADLRVFAAALIGLGSDFREVASLLDNAEVEDQYDEDVKYMFELEVDPQDDDVYQEHHKRMFEVEDEYVECDCTFEEEKVRRRELNEENEERSKSASAEAESPEQSPVTTAGTVSTTATTVTAEITAPSNLFSDLPAAVRSKESSFDEDGCDWRDIPRGDNGKYTEEFKKALKLGERMSLDAVKKELGALARETLASDRCEKVIKAVAYLVANEADKKNTSVDQIYALLNEPDTFSQMVTCNPSTSFSIVDELLMAPGLRKPLIWQLSHLKPSQWLINYFHELLIGQRGNPEVASNSDTRFPFSRKGAVVLSEMEQMMLVHEFLSTVPMKFGQKSNRSLIKLICMMLKSLDAKGVVRVNDPEYRVEIQALLIQWVGVGLIPEARELFFKSRQVDHVEDKLSKLKKQMTRRKVQIKAELESTSLFGLFAGNFTPDSPELMKCVLRFASNYDKDRSVLIRFFQGLNETQNVFKTPAAVHRVIQYFFSLLSSAVESKDIDEIVRVCEEVKLCHCDKLRGSIEEYLEEEQGHNSPLPL